MVRPFLNALFVLLAFVFMKLELYSQRSNNDKLALQYFDQKEYEKAKSICWSFMISGCPSGNLSYEELSSTFVCKVCLKRRGWRNNSDCALHSMPTTTQPTHPIDVIAVIACTST